MPKEINLENKKLVLAEEYLDGSRELLEHGSLRIATDVAYNAVELAMKVAILLKGE